MRGGGNLGGSESDEFLSELVEVGDDGGFVLSSELESFNLVVLHLGVFIND